MLAHSTASVYACKQLVGESKVNDLSHNRCKEPGWVSLGQLDGRRGVWMRVTNDLVEWCWGREGDDGYYDMRDRGLASAMHDLILTVLWLHEQDIDNTESDVLKLIESLKEST